MNGHPHGLWQRVLVEEPEGLSGLNWRFEEEGTQLHAVASRGRVPKVVMHTQIRIQCKTPASFGRKLIHYEPSHY